MFDSKNEEDKKLSDGNIGYASYNYRIDFSKIAKNVYDVKEVMDGPVYTREWKIIYEDYMPPTVAAFTTLNHDKHFPHNPHGYFFSHSTFVSSHEEFHNLKAGSPYIVLPTGEHDESQIDTLAKYLPR